MESPLPRLVSGPSQALGFPTSATQEARAYLRQERLDRALHVLLTRVERHAQCKRACVMLTEYDDESSVKLVKVELHCGLRGKEAVAKEDELLDDVLDAMDTETANRFLIVVR